MGSHLIDGKFQSDKYPTTPRGKVPLSVEDPTAQDLLWEYAQRRRSIDAEFSADLESALRAAGHDPAPSKIPPADAVALRALRGYLGMRVNAAAYDAAPIDALSAWPSIRLWIALIDRLVSKPSSRIGDHPDSADQAADYNVGWNDALSAIEKLFEGMRR